MKYMFFEEILRMRETDHINAGRREPFVDQTVNSLRACRRRGESPATKDLLVCSLGSSQPCRIVLWNLCSSNQPLA